MSSNRNPNGTKLVSIYNLISSRKKLDLTGRDSLRKIKSTITSLLIGPNTLMKMKKMRKVKKALVETGILK